MNQQKETLNALLIDECLVALKEIKSVTRKCFGYSSRCCGKDQLTTCSPNAMPLLLSVRSGSSCTMPGLMESVLSVGMNDQVVERMERLSENAHWAWDSYRRFFRSYGTSVLGVDPAVYEKILREKREERGLRFNADMSVSDLKQVVEVFKRVADIPEDPLDQLQRAIQVTSYNIAVYWSSLTLSPLSHHHHQIITPGCLYVMVL